jgi:hypothetical protein
MSKPLLLVSFLLLLSIQACNSNGSKKEATKQPAPEKSFSEATFLDITPLADGGAYASDLTGGLWYLRAGEAVKVREVNQLSVQPSSLLSTKRERALWSALQHERAKRKSAESDRDLYANNTDDSEYDPR